MTTILQQLQKKEDLESFLMRLVDYIYTSFQSAKPITEEKTYASLRKLTNKIYKNFPNHITINNLTTKLVLNTKQMIDDKYKDQNKIRKNKEVLNLIGFLNGIDTAEQQNSDILESDLGWVRKALLDQIQYLKQDLKQSQEIIAKSVATLLNKNETILYYQSFLKNQSIIETVKKTKGLSIKQIKKSGAQKSKNQISLLDAAKQIIKCSKVILSACLILKDGGILAENGAALIAVAAKHYKIPVIAISRNFCLTSKVILGQSTLHVNENPLKNFQIDSNEFKVFISKSYEYVEPNLIQLIVTESGIYTPQNVQALYQAYYQ